MFKKIKAGAGKFLGYFNLKKKIGGYLVSFGTKWLLKKINGYLVEAQKGGDLEKLRTDVELLLVVAMAIDEAGTIAAEVLTKLLSITADGKIDKKEAKAATKLLKTATKNFKGLMKK